MKAEFKEGILTLRAETDEEKKFLDKVGYEGLRNFGSGSCNTLALPSIAGVKQFHLTPDQITVIVFALGRADSYLRRSYGPEKTDGLLSEIFK